ncbi:helix-turn-helix domain-containing protein [Streptomyces sp. NBC_00654]|uniref:helix-turn-helix domain-containing protein n=1 Tax=Streptomyces sp. NBC_00654 TaxID=2975799 RepID=UPI00224E2B08|nr:helix-turn-helix domain-containing protein [Streptomyces sp. NBC_00654]MCX4964346.1 helix-turn-helix domain-containing protein [Streptomyces sp. NBC_00654]
MTRSTTDTAAADPLPSPKERRRLREAKSLTEEQVAAAVGVTRATVRSWETGRTSPRGRKRTVYAKLIGSSAEDAARTARAPRPALTTSNTGVNPAAEGETRPPATSTAPKASGASEASGASGASEPVKATEVSRPAEASGPSETPEPSEPNAPRPTAAAPAIRPESPAPAVSSAPATPPVPAAPGTPPESPSPPAPDVTGLSPTEAFDALYSGCAQGLVRQTYLLTGRRNLSVESVERAFQLAWHRWPEVAVDRDPAGWVRAAAYEYAMSPWHRLRRAHRHPDAPPAEPDRRALRDALLDLPPSYRRTLLLYDGVGLDLPETAAETEASTPAAAGRLMNARAAVAERLPELAGSASPTEQSALLHEKLGALALAGKLPALPPARTVRTGSERKAQLWTRAAIAFAALLIGATGFTLHTAPTRYEQPLSPPERVGGVPPRGGPQKLTSQDLELQKTLREQFANGPERLVPRIP